MPVTMSIEWKPLRDSYYVVASLHPGGGVRHIFARQSILRELQDLARGDPERPVVGLLLGERLDCSITLKPYVLIESHVEVALASLDERTVSDAIRTLRSHIGRLSPEVLGWFSSTRSTDAAISRTLAAVHAACFTERWQTVLTFGNSGNSGAFFLHDSTASRWFHAPFYEVTDSKTTSQAPKVTSIAWPAYLTTASVVPLVEAPQRVPVAPPRTLAAPVSAPVHDGPVPSARPVARVPRTPARDAIVGMSRVASAARRSALDLAIVVGSSGATALRHGIEGIVQIRAKWAANSAQRKADAHAANTREEERRAREAARRRAADEEAQRRAAEVRRQRAAEAEARRAAEAEARQRAARVAEQRRAVEAEAARQAAEAEAQRQAEAAEARRAAEVEAQRIAAEEAQLRAAEAEVRRKAAEEAQRIAAEEEQRRAAEAEVRRQAAEAEARRQAADAEELRVAEAQAEAQRLSEEAEAERRRRAAEAEEDAQRSAAEAEALRISVEVAAIRERLAREPVEGSKRETSRATAYLADVEDTSASDGPYRYLALARREGFEVSEKIERGTAEHPETVWLLHERESGLRLIVVTTDEAVREASLHYNIRTEDDSLLRITAPEHRNLESRTIYRREPCLHELRARCRRLRATGALQRDWKALPPTLQSSSQPHHHQQQPQQQQLVSPQ